MHEFWANFAHFVREFKKQLTKSRYTIIKEKDITIVIILAGTRENFYNQLKRYMK